MGVTFLPVAMLGPLGLFKLQQRWEEEYPHLEVKGALPAESVGPTFGLVVGDAAPPLRIWANGGPSGLLLQSQQDRLVLNWRRDFATEGQYPGFESLLGTYSTAWQEMCSYLGDAEEPAPNPTGAEFTYVNPFQLLDSETPESVMELLTTPTSPLPGSPSLARFQFVRDVECDETHPFSGRIVVQGEPSFQAGTRSLIVSVSTHLRTDHPGASPIEMLEAAHALSTHTFALVTSPKKHEEWGRYK